MTTTTKLVASPRPRVLFVGDDGSTQIAASLLRRLAGERIEVGTAGVDVADPGGRADEMLVAMGLDPADGRRVSASALIHADRVVALGSGLDVARLAGPRYEEWDVAHEDLARRVERLCVELVAEPPEDTSRSLRVRLRNLLRSVTPRRS